MLLPLAAGPMLSWSPASESYPSHSVARHFQAVSFLDLPTFRLPGSPHFGLTDLTQGSGLQKKIKSLVCRGTATWWVRSRSEGPATPWCVTCPAMEVPAIPQAEDRIFPKQGSPQHLRDPRPEPAHPSCCCFLSGLSLPTTATPGQHNVSIKALKPGERPSCWVSGWHGAVDGEVAGLLSSWSRAQVPIRIPGELSWEVARGSPRERASEAPLTLAEPILASAHSWVLSSDWKGNQKVSPIARLS